MSTKKDRFNHRRWRRGPHPWAVPASYKRGLRRLLRARARQRLREGDYDYVPRYFRDAAWSYW